MHSRPFGAIATKYWRFPSIPSDSHPLE
jgi:hypothetical protein